jgi:leader peptidase (prepilin peptidase)/N-methyltransferase
MTTAFWTLTVFALLFGAIVGSFLNVIIYRRPAGESIVSPPSRCPSCERRIRWYDNIPVVSWFVLGGECRHCGARISWRYPAVEAATGGLSVALWFKVARGHFETAYLLENLPVWGIAVPFFLYFAFLCVLVVIALVDLDHYIVPHEFTLPGIALGLAAPWLIRWLVPAGALQGFWPPVTPGESFIGFVAGGLSVLSVYVLYLVLRGVEGLGGGDVTLMALVGAWLGWPALIFVFFAASMQGTLAAAVAYVGESDWLTPHDELFPDEEAEGEAVERPDERETPEVPKPTGDEPPEEPTDAGKLAVPFGPFIVLSAIEHFFLGPYLPRILSMSYMYEMWYW